MSLLSNSEFPADFFVQNRRRLRSEFGGQAPIVISANGLLQKSLDSAYPFHQDSNFYYLTGVNEPGLVLVMEKSREYIILPKQSEYMQTFDGEIDVSNVSGRSGVQKVYEFDKGWSKLGSTLRSAKHVAGIDAPEAFIEELDMYTNPARARLQKMVLDQNPSLRFIDIKPQLSNLRTIKQPLEIEAIQRATTATMRVMSLLSKKIKDCRSENELAAVATSEFVRENLQHAYTPIVAAGKNAVTLHYIANNQPFKENQLVLIDMGAEYSHYSSDLTRTIGIKPTKRQLEVHAAVAAVLEYALGALKPGTTLDDFEKQVREFMGQKLIELGLIKSIDLADIRRFYPHSTTHCVGLDVHDPSPSDGVLKTGMVLTVEPGIYIPSEGIGVRIEDIVLITETGIKNLSSGLSRGASSLTIDNS